MGESFSSSNTFHGVLDGVEISGSMSRQLISRNTLDLAKSPTVKPPSMMKLSMASVLTLLHFP